MNGLEGEHGHKAVMAQASDGSLASDKMPYKDGDILGETATLEAQGTAHFNRLGWKRLTVVLIVEAIALGSLSIPSAFATLGMVAGVICCVGIGLIAIYTSYVVGQVKLKFPEVAHYADAGRLLMGKFGYELIGAMFTLQLVFLVGSHWYVFGQLFAPRLRNMC